MSLRISTSSKYAVLISLALTAVTVKAEISQTQWMKLNKASINEHVLPGYQRLALASKALEQATADLCQNLTDTHLKQTQSRFNDMLNAWQGIQHVQFGPIELLMRSYTIQFWPDKKNLTSKQLNTVLNNAEPATLTPDYFQTASIAVKGLPAMERILFAEQPLKALKQQTFRCDFLHAISSHLEMQTQNTLNEWKLFKKEFDYTSSEEGAYESAQEATIDLMKAQVEPLEVIRDLKLLRPLGKTHKAKPRRLENWRSRNALLNIQTNIKSLHHLFSGAKDYSLFALLSDHGAIDLAEGIEQQFVALEALLAQVPAPLSHHINEPAVREQLLLITQGISLLHKSLDKSMSTLELQLGFNSRDGD